jgi:hypothetical protein
MIAINKISSIFGKREAINEYYSFLVVKNLSCIVLMHRKKRIGNIINNQMTSYNNTHFWPSSRTLIL